MFKYPANYLNCGTGKAWPGHCKDSPTSWSTVKVWLVTTPEIFGLDPPTGSNNRIKMAHHKKLNIWRSERQTISNLLDVYFSLQKVLTKHLLGPKTQEKRNLVRQTKSPQHVFKSSSLRIDWWDNLIPIFSKKLNQPKVNYLCKSSRHTGMKEEGKPGLGRATLRFG